MKGDWPGMVLSYLPGGEVWLETRSIPSLSRIAWHGRWVFDVAAAFVRTRMWIWGKLKLTYILSQDPFAAVRGHNPAKTE
jgi:hypothetical protein